MGSCSSTSTDDIIKTNRINNQVTHANMVKSVPEPFDLEKEKEKVNPKFRDMPEWEGDRFTGEGIKKMRGYKCNLKIDELQDLREEFWEKKIKERVIWTTIKQACIYHEARACSLLRQFHLTPVDKCINHLVDSNHNHYYIPNFCINDPYFEKEFDDLKFSVERSTRPFKVHILESAKNKTISLKVTSATTGEELKKMIVSKAEIDIDNKMVRLFFGGNIIRDEHKLIQYGVEDDYTIQMMVSDQVS